MTDRYDSNDEDTQVASRSALLAALATNKARRPCLIVIAGKMGVGKVFKVEGEAVIGRGNAADLRLEEDGVSRMHVRLAVRHDGTVEAVDLQSTNGTYVNGDKCERVVLRDGDKLQIGDATILKFSYQDELEEALQKNLYESATRDPLTRVHNKRSFAEALPREFAFAVRHRRPLSLVALDVDHFKRINDTHGHPAGDFVLQKLAAIVESQIRAEDVLARCGGEEFAILMRDTTLPQAARAAERVRHAVACTPFVFDGRRLAVTLSAGVATGPDAAIGTFEDMIRTADERLYVAKRTGRNRVVVGADCPAAIPA